MTDVAVEGLPARGRRLTEAVSDDGRWTAIHADHNVTIRGPGGRNSVTTDGTEAFHTAPRLCRRELDQTEAMWWSPDGRYLAFYGLDVSTTRDYHLVDELLAFAARSRRTVPKAGDPNPIAGLRIRNVATSEIITVDVGPEDDQYVYAVRWTPDGSDAHPDQPPPDPRDPRGRSGHREESRGRRGA